MATGRDGAFLLRALKGEAGGARLQARLDAAAARLEAEASPGAAPVADRPAKSRSKVWMRRSPMSRRPRVKWAAP